MAGFWEGCEGGQISWYYTSEDSSGEIGGDWSEAYFIGEFQDNQDLYIVGQYYNTGLEEQLGQNEICGSLQFYNCNDELAINYNSHKEDAEEVLDQMCEKEILSEEQFGWYKKSK